MEPQIYSRYDDPSPIKCMECGWKGQVKDAIHTYHDDGTTNPDGSPTGEVEPIDECPECGGDYLEDIK